MADNKGNDPKTGPDNPAEPKSGAVKPPVLDLTAREGVTSASVSGTAGPSEKLKSKASAAKDAQSDAKKTTKPASSVPSTKPAENAVRGSDKKAGFPIGATLAGGVLGLAVAYGLAAAGYWPSSPAPAAPADPRLAQFATAIPELETVTQTTQSELATLNQRIAELEQAEPAAPAPAPATTPTAPPAPGVDLGPIEAEIAQLQSRLDALPPPATPNGDVEALRSDIAGLGTRLDELAARLDGTERNLATLDSTVAETSAALAEQPADISAVLQLPLILSGLETAFSTGRPFQAELQALRNASPDLAPPTTLANAAGSGLARPDLIAQRFNEVLPAIIAAQPADPDAQWQQGAVDWFNSAIALRPTGEMEGDTPQAVTSRLEGAIARRDFAAANTLFAALPEPMRIAAGDVPALVAAQADAEQFLQTVRTETLASEAAQ